MSDAQHITRSAGSSQSRDASPGGRPVRRRAHSRWTRWSRRVSPTSVSSPFPASCQMSRNSNQPLNTEVDLGLASLTALCFFPQMCSCTLPVHAARTILRPQSPGRFVMPENPSHRQEMPASKSLMEFPKLKFFKNCIFCNCLMTCNRKIQLSRSPNISSGRIAAAFQVKDLLSAVAADLWSGMLKLSTPPDFNVARFTACKVFP